MNLPSIPWSKADWLFFITGTIVVLFEAAVFRWWYRTDTETRRRWRVETSRDLITRVWLIQVVPPVIWLVARWIEQPLVK